MVLFISRERRLLHSCKSICPYQFMCKHSTDCPGSLSMTFLGKAASPITRAKYYGHQEIPKKPCGLYFRNINLSSSFSSQQIETSDGYIGVLWSNLESARFSPSRFPFQEDMERILRLWRTPCLSRYITPHLGRLRTWDCVQLLSGTAVVMTQLASNITDLVSSLNMSDTSMTFGQIVGAKIWVPVLLEYYYLDISELSIIHRYRSCD